MCEHLQTFAGRYLWESHDQKHAVEIVTKLLKIMTDEVVGYIHNVSPMKHIEKTNYNISCVESSYIK